MSIATWTPERIDQLRSYVDTGLTCSQIAAEIGVTRNAVIGKIHRLGLASGRPATESGRPCPPRVRQPRVSSQRQVLRVMFAETPYLADGAAPAPIESPQCCSLLELAQGKCRWPISDPGAADFGFCGNEALRGFSYCSGHARMAYRSPTRRRA